MIALKVVLTIVLVVVIIVMALRARKLLRDRAHYQVPQRDARLVLPPSSPYSISKGFRLLDGGVPLNERPQPPRPRLETSHEYVFSDAQLAAPYELSAEARHNSKWALERSTNRSRMPSVRLWAVLLVALLLIGALVAGYLVLDHHPRAPAASSASGATTTTTTATSTSATSSVARPATLSPVSSTAQGATYVIAVTDYSVTVTTSAGPLKVAPSANSGPSGVR